LGVAIKSKISEMADKMSVLKAIAGLLRILLWSLTSREHDIRTEQMGKDPPIWGDRGPRSMIDVAVNLWLLLPLITVLGISNEVRRVYQRPADISRTLAYKDVIPKGANRDARKNSWSRDSSILEAPDYEVDRVKCHG
jgi:hypothetical protein